MSIVPFSFELAEKFYHSVNRFPVDFELAWVWLGYSKKDKALKTLKSNFTEGEDFALLQEGEWTQEGRSSDLYGMTVNCFKEMGMIAGTDKGREVRQHFIRCEEKLKELLQAQQPTIKDELDVIKMCLEAANLQPALTAGVMLNHAGTRMPQLKGAVEEGHSLLAASLESDLLLTPTKIGKELGVSGRRVNQILLDLGYQVKNLKKTSKTEPDYLVTEIGKPYAGNTLATGKLQSGKADNTTYQHLKWKEEVIEIVREHLPE